MKENLKTIKQLLAQQLTVFPEDIKEDNRIKKDLGADSLDSLQLIVSVEEKFDIHIDHKEATNIITVNDVLILVNKKTA